VIAKISQLFHCFDSGYFDPRLESPLFPPEWADWGRTKKNRLAFPKNIRANKVTTTLVLGALACLMIWFS
jgi:hypothetical protein